MGDCGFEYLREKNSGYLSSQISDKKELHAVMTSAKCLTVLYTFRRKIQDNRLLRSLSDALLCWIR